MCRVGRVVEQVAVELGRSCRPWRGLSVIGILDRSSHCSCEDGESVEDEYLSGLVLELDAALASKISWTKLSP